MSAARNAGIVESGAELIAFLDADDEWMPDFLEVIMRLREEYPEAGIYGTSYVIMTENGNHKAPRLKGLPSPQWEGVLQSYFKTAAYSDSRYARPRHAFLNIFFKRSACLSWGREWART